MQDITAWLHSDQDFHKGVELYKQYGRNTFFKDLLTSAGPTPYNTQKLCVELTKLAPASPAIVPASTVPQPIQAEPFHAPTAERKVSPSDHARYIRICKERDDVTRQLDRNMAALDYSNDQNVLHHTAKQILRLHQKKQELWALVDYYNEHQTFEPEVHVEPPSREKQMQLIYQSICKARKRLKDPDYTEKARTEKLIEKKLKELEELKGEKE